MLNALIAFSAVLVSEAGSWDPAPFMAGPTHTSSPLFVPDEPRTLVLALIGIGIIGVYAGMQRWLRPGRGATKMSQPYTTSKRAA